MPQKSRLHLKRPIVFPGVEQGCGISGPEQEKVVVCEQGQGREQRDPRNLLVAGDSQYVSYRQAFPPHAKPGPLKSRVRTCLEEYFNNEPFS